MLCWGKKKTTSLFFSIYIEYLILTLKIKISYIHEIFVDGTDIFVRRGAKGLVAPRRVERNLLGVPVRDIDGHLWTVNIYI